jgi:hypothetical protein
VDAISVHGTWKPSLESRRLPQDAPGSRHKIGFLALCHATPPCYPTGGGNRTWSHTAPSSALLNVFMIYAWSEILPAAIERLPPIQRELVRYVMSQPGKRRPSYAYVSERWALTGERFDEELAAAYASLRHHLRRYGLDGADDLELR